MHALHGGLENVDGSFTHMRSIKNTHFNSLTGGLRMKLVLRSCLCMPL